MLTYIALCHHEWKNGDIMKLNRKNHGSIKNNLVIVLLRIHTRYLNKKNAHKEKKHFHIYHRDEKYNLFSFDPKFNIPLLFILCILCLAGILMVEFNKKNNNIQEHIAQEIIRFHVIANSDRQEDQELKLKVKDALVEEFSPLLKGAETIEEGRSLLQSNLYHIQDCAAKVINLYGYDYSVSVSLEPSYFPMKLYGGYTFPPGTYEALRVQIGEAVGQNWWCVMFPPLCFVDETYSIVDSDTEEQLSKLLTEEEISTLKTRRVPVKYKFKLWKGIKRLFR